MASRREEDSTGWHGQAVLAYADTLYNFARYLSENSTDAEDLVQETYARSLRPPGNSSQAPISMPGFYPASRLGPLLQD
jgi:DNA-directed RNA polymerase specialized sigma24 family protein